MVNAAAKKCPICADPGNIAARDEDLNVYRCGLCGHVFGLVPKERRESYGEDYFAEAHRNYFENPDRRMYSFIYSEILRFIDRKDISILDAGCGQGEFLKYIASKNPEASLTGIDLTDNHHPSIRFLKGDVLKTDLGRGFDVICSLAVIEHLDDPALFLMRLKDALKPGGIMAIMTINDDGLICGVARLMNKVGMRGPYGRVYDSHNLQYFTAGSLKKLMELGGLEALAYRKHNYSLRSVDVPAGGIFSETIYRLAAGALFLLSVPLGSQLLQTIVCRKPE
ncbi:MAG: class I SAM-dependent methyltransferase [Candidatus Omnitrophota bacterium]